MVVDRETLLDFCEKVINKALEIGATQAEVRVINFRRYLTRFANSYIHQNTGETNSSITLRFVLGKRIGTVSINELSEENIDKLVKTGLKVAKVQEENPEFVSLPEPEPVPELKEIFVKKTSECSADTRAELVKELITTAHNFSPKVHSVAGALSTSQIEITVTNSLGIQAYSKATLASVNTNIIARENGVEGFGYAAFSSHNIDEIDPTKIGLEAAERAVNSLGAKKIDLGEYEVILNPYAIATAMVYAGMNGFNARAVQDGLSFMLDLRGKKAFFENLTIWDDGLDLRGIAFPFDMEGVPKKKVVLVEKGVPKNVVYDSYTAHKESKKSTGHAASYGPMPTHVFIAPGDSSLEEMISETKKGLLVTRFHYVRTVHARKLVITGMTRDGTWLIENGEIKTPVKNLRFTESLLRTFSHIQLMSKETRRVGLGILYGLGSVVTPYLKIEKFQFTGVTEY
ncbi:MAG: TldD/PmbA family protein [Candidatus Njordarchaeales archaeon]